MRGIVRRIAPDTNCFLLYLIPIVLIMFLHFDFNYLVFGTIAFNMMLCALYLLPLYIDRQMADDSRDHYNTFALWTGRVCQHVCLLCRW